MHYLLMYDVVPDYAERRAPLRAAHLAHAWAAVDRGELVLGGALAAPAGTRGLSPAEPGAPNRAEAAPCEGAVLFFDCDSPEVVEAFARADPYVQNGLVTRWRVRAWATVAGEAAKNPIRELS
jgi:uncharacterized protein YciI